MYNGSLADSFQLAISVNCLTLLTIIVAVYFGYYLQNREKTFLAGGVVTLDIALFVLAETLIIVQGWHGNVVIGRHLHRIEQIPIFLFLATLPFFLQHAFPVAGVLKKILRVIFWLGVVVTVGVAVAAYAFPESLISISNASLTPPVSPGDFTRGLEGPLFILRDITLAVAVLFALFYSIYYILKIDRGFQSIMLFLGIASAIFGGIDDIQYLYSGHNIILDSLRFSRFTLCSTVMIMFFIAAVFSRYFQSSTMLKKTTQELEVSENKYSLLMDAANEIMFSLSEDLTIISANEKAEKIFHIGDSAVNFIDCLYLIELDDDKDNQYFKEQLMELQDEGDKLTFNTYIKDWVTFEPVEYHFRFDCFYNGVSLELIGRAWPAASSKLLEFIGTERLSLKVENYITMVGDIVDKLTSNLRRYLEEADVMMIKMGLNEMIVNAMEHGNLGVSFDEKTQAQEEGRLFEFMGERRLLPEYRDKKVSIDYYFDETKVIFRITDMGPGFDYHKMMDRVKNEVNQQSLSHGRGIIMTQAVFDTVEYNNKGNQVLMIKEFNKGNNA